jgi:hypothetical protein
VNKTQVFHARDTQEIPYAQGAQAFAVVQKYKTSESLLDDWQYCKHKKTNHLFVVVVVVC